MLVLAAICLIQRASCPLFGLFDSDVTYATCWPSGEIAALNALPVAVSRDHLAFAADGLASLRDIL